MKERLTVCFTLNLYHLKIMKADSTTVQNVKYILRSYNQDGSYRLFRNWVFQSRHRFSSPVSFCRHSSFSRNLKLDATETRSVCITFDILPMIAYGISDTIERIRLCYLSVSPSKELHQKHIALQYMHIHISLPEWVVPQRAGWSSVFTSDTYHYNIWNVMGSVQTE